MKQVKITFSNGQKNTRCTIIPKTVGEKDYLISARQARKIGNITDGIYDMVKINNRTVKLYIDDNGSGDFYAHEES